MEQLARFGHGPFMKVMTEEAVGYVYAEGDEKIDDDDHAWIDNDTGDDT